MTDLVPVWVTCPTGEHADGDAVSLKPKMGLAGGTEAQQIITNIAKGMTAEAMTGLMMEVYLRHGIAEWTLHDDAGKSIVLTPESLRAQLLDDFARAQTVADKADELYYQAVVAPLVAAVSKSSRATRAEPSTSVSMGSPASHRKRSKRSSTSTTPMGDIELTSV